MRGIDLAGHGAVVLGAGQGIGEKCCYALASAGAKVLCVDRDASLAARVADAVGGVACATDCCDASEMERVFGVAAQTLPDVHAVVNIIGIAFPKDIADITDAAWQAQFDIVLKPALWALRFGAAHVAPGGSFAFVGSMAGERALPKVAAYGSAKAALHHLVQAAAMELGPRGIRVNAVAPGYVRTPRLQAALTPADWERMSQRVPLGRVAEPADIADVLLFLCSDLARYVSGAVLPVDGGTTVGL